MTRAEIIAHNAGAATFAALAAASAEALRLRLTAAPTRYNFAIEALVALVDAAPEILLPLPPNDSESAAAVVPVLPVPLSGEAMAIKVSA